jgi:hypothetical protein
MSELETFGLLLLALFRDQTWDAVVDAERLIALNLNP